MKITRDFLRSARPDIEKDLAAFAAKHGLSVSVKNIKFSDSSFEAKVEFSVLSSGGVAMTPERKHFIELASLYGVDPSFLDKSFRHGGHVYTVVGLNPKKRKNPIVMKRSDGSVRISGPEFVNLYMKTGLVS